MNLNFLWNNVVNLSLLSLTIISASVLSLSDQSIASLRDSASTSDYADWCSACRAYKPLFHEFAEKSQLSQPDLKFAAINYADSPVTIMRFGITSLPSIYHVRNGEYRDISDHRRNLSKYLTEKGWNLITPMKSWMAPFSSFGNAMAIVGSIGLFIVSHVSMLSTMNFWQLMFVLMASILGFIVLILMLAIFEKLFLNKKKREINQERKDK